MGFMDREMKSAKPKEPKKGFSNEFIQNCMRNNKITVLFLSATITPVRSIDVSNRGTRCARWDRGRAEQSCAFWSGEAILGN